jgi:hypothetical protein
MKKISSRAANHLCQKPFGTSNRSRELSLVHKRFKKIPQNLFEKRRGYLCASFCHYIHMLVAYKSTFHFKFWKSTVQYYKKAQCSRSFYPPYFCLGIHFNHPCKHVTWQNFRPPWLHPPSSCSLPKEHTHINLY